MVMRWLGGLGIVAAAGVIALNARDSLRRPAADGSAVAPAAARRLDVEGATADRTSRAAGTAAIATTTGDGATPAAANPATAGRPGAPAGASPQTAAGAMSRDPADHVTAAPDGPSPAAPGASGVPAGQSQGTAEAILTRASAAYARVRSLRATFVEVTQNPLLGSTTTSRGTLFQRRPDRLLLRFSEPKGDILVSDGRYFWVYYPSADPKQVMRLPAATGGGALDLQAQFLGDPVKRFSATLEGTQNVDGRPADVLRLTPKAAAPYRELKVWLDRRDHLARRFEVTEENGTVRRFDLKDLRPNVVLPDALFHFEPPAGAHIVDQG